MNQLPKKYDLFKMNVSNFNEKEDYMLFREDFLQIDWPETLQLNKQDVNVSFNNFHNKLEALLDKYLPLKKSKKRTTKKI